jgi:epoxide hydrolase-like predicted phosphatase
MATLSSGIRAVCFDFGGVIMRTADPTPRQQLAERLGVSLGTLLRVIFDSESARLASLGAISAEEHWRQAMQELHLAPQEAEAFATDFFRGDILDMELVDFIRALRPTYRTALISNAWSDLRAFLSSQQIADAFDEVIISAEVGLMKPDARIYHLALERLGIAPQEAVFLDDFAENVAAARTIGMHAIQFVQPQAALQELKQLLDHRSA